MYRRILFGMLALLIGLIAGNSAVIGDDKVERRDPKTGKTAIVEGKIVDESITGIKVKTGAKDELIPAGEVTRVFHDDIPGPLKLAYSNLWVSEGKEKDKDLVKLLKDYKDFISRLNTEKGVSANSRRYLEFRVLALEAGMADNDEAKADIRRRLETFVTSHGTSWEYPFAARTLARMFLDKADFEGAAKVLEPLARGPTVPADIKQEADLLLVDALFQAGKTEEVKSRIAAALADVKATDAQKARFKVYQIGLDASSPDAKIEDVVKKLDDVIAKSSENTIKALAYNIMGDCFRKKQRSRDAMWAYLWVDVVYSQDKTEHLKAMGELLKIFEEEKDNEKVQLYKDKIARIR